MMSRSIILRLTPYFASRIRHNHRLLSSSSASSSLSSSLCPPSLDDAAAAAIHMTQNCVQRMKELQSNEASKSLRLTVETGGCSGFQYVFLLDDKTNPDDRIFENEGVKLVVDNISYDFVKGATVDYVEELIRAAFVGEPKYGNLPLKDNYNSCRVRIAQHRTSCMVDMDDLNFDTPLWILKDPGN